MIPVTKAFLPPWGEFQEVLAGTWDSRHLTNHGPLVERLEGLLASKLGVKHVVCVSSGTLALELALVAAGVAPDDEVVTTAFSYIATPAAARWMGARPILADIDPFTLCLDPKAAKRAISDHTTAILPVHVYGNPCDVEGFAALSEETGIPVIYDAAHAFDGHVARHGVCSAFSFHATKLFHTAEGGAVATDDPLLAARVRSLRNFGHRGPNSFGGLGINGKMSELHAAMGLSVLPHMSEIIEGRGRAVAAYDGAFAGKGVANGCRSLGNVAYYPVLFKDEKELLQVNAALVAEDILARRYFHPSLSYLPYTQRAEGTPVADSVAPRVLCLPLYHDLSPDEARRIAGVVLEAIR